MQRKFSNRRSHDDIVVSIIMCLAIPGDGLKQPENMEQDDSDKHPDQRTTR